MKTRMKELRKTLKLTQKEISDGIGVTQSAYASYEMGRAIPSGSTIQNICKTFSVNEQWLRTGEGEMFAPKQDGIEEFLVKNHLNPKCREALEIVFGLPEVAQAAFADFVTELANRKQREKADLREQVKEELRAEVEAEALEKARQELRAEMEGSVTNGK